VIGIYKITSPNGRIYIGQSTDIEYRFSIYKRLKCRQQSRLYNSFVKHGVNNHVFDVIEECSVDLLNERERHWQDFYNVLGKAGLNCVLVSTSSLQKVVSDETKAKISNSVTGFKHTEEAKAKISRALTGRPMSEIARHKLMEYNKNKQVSPETCKKISEALTGRKIPKEVIDKRRWAFLGGNNPNAKPIVNLQNGVFYDCVSEAAECYGLNRSTLNNFLVGSRKNKTYLVYA
jgi:group I intron endonuclease